MSSSTPDQQATTASTAAQAQMPKPAGKLKLDATVADIYITYPTDLDLLHKSRVWSEKIIDHLHKFLPKSKKPRTYRRLARQSYLNIAKKKKKSSKELRVGLRMQLNCLERNLGYIDKMLKEVTFGALSLPRNYLRYYQVIQETYAQQHQMYQTKCNSCPSRIVSLSQPYVRPIVRGKNKGRVEFGPKLGLSLVGGYTRIETFSWEAYHEGNDDFEKGLENYYKLYGHYPELVQVDQIYATRANRQKAQELGIRMTAKPLGRPKKDEKGKESPAQRRKRKQEHAERNHIEGKIGQGKQGYRLNQIRTKTQPTAESWISCIVFVMNLIQFKKDINNKKINYFLWWFNLLLGRLVYRGDKRVNGHENSKVSSRLLACAA